MVSPISELLSRCPIVAAPMAELTDMAFRLLARDFFDGLLHTEMVSGHALIQGDAKTLVMASPGEEEKGPIAAQILASDEKTASTAARELSSLPLAALDINMACPVKKILKSGCGAALLEHPEHAGRILRAARENCPFPVTAKIRLGRNAVTAERVLEHLTAAGAAAVTLHGRTADQLYQGRADRARSLALASTSPIPVIVSGDVYTPDDAREVMEGGAAGVLIARGMIGRPWFPGVVAALISCKEPPAVPARSRIIERHLELILQLHGDSGIPRFRRHLVEYARGVAGAARLRKAFVTARNAEELRGIVAAARDSLDGGDAGVSAF